MNYNEEVRAYFAKKAHEYDLVDDQLYWRLSDRLLWDLLDERVLTKLPEGYSTLDAGGGTGRWSQMILREKKSGSLTLIDMSEEMLEVARKKLLDQYQSRVSILNANLDDTFPFSPEVNFDLCINFHNVLGFVNDPKETIARMFRITKAGGAVVTVAPNLYHGVYFNLSQHRLDEATTLAAEARGRFTADMPSIKFFRPSDLKSLYSVSGLDNIEILGFPVCVYPGFEETQLRGSSTAVGSLLDNDAQFDQIYRLEKGLVVNEESAARGNNLMIIGWKPHERELI